MKTSKQRREQRKRAKLRMSNSTAMPSASQAIFEIIEMNMFANMAPVSGVSGKKCTGPVACKQEKEMNQISPEKTYLSRRLDNIEYNVERSLPKKFGLQDDDRPRTPNDLIARITSGKYVVAKGRENTKVYDPMDFIRWRDPATVEDQVGHEAAVAKLHADAQAARDVIVVKDLDSGLKALQDFETANLIPN